MLRPTDNAIQRFRRVCKRPEQIENGPDTELLSDGTDVPHRWVKHLQNILRTVCRQLDGSARTWENKNPKFVTDIIRAVASESS